MTGDVLTRPDAAPTVRSRLTAEEFMIAAEAGAFGDAHVELVDGEIVEMPPEGNSHSDSVWRTGRVLDRIVERFPHLNIGSNKAVVLGTGRLVGPDVVVHDRLRPAPEMTPASAVRLAIEHSYSTRSYDLNRKSQLYAEAGVPEYWVLDVVAIELHRFHSPQDGRYTREPPLGRGTYRRPVCAWRDGARGGLVPAELKQANVQWPRFGRLGVWSGVTSYG